MYNRDSKLMRKLLGKGAADPDPAVPPPTYRPPKSQNAVYPSGAPVACFDVAPDRRAAVLAGPHVLKTVVLEPGGFSVSQGVDVRAAITTRQPPAGGGVAADQLNIRDAKWHGNSSTIFTACASGKIFAYDVARLGAGSASEPIEYIQMQEDSRQVNTLDVNPHLKSWVLSGSQDGAARVFDASTPLQNRAGLLTFRQRFAPLRCIESVRQVKWSPRVGHEMACCTDGGIVLKWDVRQPSRPLLRLNAHEKGCSAIAWHPDGIHLMSAGADTKMHVWDLGPSADKRQKPKFTISTPAPVVAVAWRPGLWSTTAQTRRLAQVAVSYDETSNRRYGTSAVHIWDLARPTMPYKEIERFESSPSALAWQDRDMLWTVGPDGMFNQCDVAFAPRVLDRQSTSAMAFSPRGDVVMFLDERPQSQRPRPSVVHEPELHRQTSYSPSPNAPPVLSVSRSDSEDEVMGTFLAPRRRHRRRLSGRQLSTTPPGPEDKLLNLEQSVSVTGVFRTQQAMASGRIPAAKPVHLYQFLSGAYLETLHKELPCVEGKPLVERVGHIMEQFARAAETATVYRLAQTWRILAYAMTLLLNRRAQYHLERRIGQFQKLPSEDRVRLKLPAGAHGGEETPRRPSTQRGGSIDGRLLSRSLLAEEIESTSNVPTPVARPADDIATGQHEAYEYGRKLTPIVEPESLNLGPAAHGSFRESPRRRLDSEPVSDTSHDDSEHSQTSYTEGYDFYDAEVLAKAIDVPMPRFRGRAVRHDSDESFGQMFSISEGKRSARSGSSSGDVFAKPIARQESTLERSSASSVDDDSRRQSPTKYRKDSSDDMFMISQTTKSDEYPSQSFTDSDRKPSDAPDVEVVDRSRSPSKPAVSPKHDPRKHIIETDYLPWDDDPPYPFPLADKDALPSPLDPYALLTRALDFETRTSALNASAMVLLLKPLVPESVIDGHRAAAILRQHHARLARMSLFVEAALLRNLCVEGWPAGLPDWGDNYTAIFGPAQQGVKVGLFCPSCRKPHEVDPARGSEAVWTCERCRAAMGPCAVCGHREPERPADIPSEIADAPGPGDTWLEGWWFCPGCAHGGHASCLQTWHAALDPNPAPSSDPSAKYSDGCCPSDGCGHACLPGRYRGETATQRAEDIGRVAAADAARSTPESTAAAHHHERRASGALYYNRSNNNSRSNSRRTSPARGTGAAAVAGAVEARGGGGGSASVKSDGNDVPQSKAVGMAREALMGGGGVSGGVGGGVSGKAGSASPAGGILSSSPGSARLVGTPGSERERRKSVKFARTDRA
ncbi:SEA (Seh1-associated) complex subunit [Purpureocillium takamizusanense]|uniref:SEA (Seh1-associated) complex subunit n=1 Tax=Purpureocillium takamizusanense TaxID=2060973 RepID=A0A9Q8VDS2_9HYPO|nr:SEA (Seh1-associated) complex subunit [Purpureocillium takamizusanense]UNI23090.1 SEA (Seh1-associated) complex subunit [Purpureocillium takamizusanense]